MTTQTEIVIVGAGGLGRECHAYLNDDGYNIAGFIDDSIPTHNDLNVPILSTIKAFTPKENQKVLLAIGNPEIRETIFNELKQKKVSLLTYIHSSAFIGTHVSLGEGVIISPKCILTTNITLGTGVIINTNTTIGHDTTVDDFTTVNGKCEITGKNKIGKKCYIGVGSIVIPEKTIEDNVTIGAGSVVIQNAKTNHTYFGNPAKKISRGST